MDISVIRTTNPCEVYPAVLGCFTDIVEDGTEHEAVENYVDVHRDCWLKVGSAGFVQLTPYNRSMLEIHPFIAKNMRNQSEQAVQAAIGWFDNEAPDMYQSLVTNIPACKRYATLFAAKMGFKQVGAYAKGFKKDGKYHDMLLFQRMRVR